MNITLCAMRPAILLKSIFSSGLQLLPATCRVLLLRPAAGTVLLVAGGLLIVHSTQPDGTSLQGTLIELITVFQSIPAEELANKITDILLSGWLSLTLLSVALEAISQFTRPRAVCYAITGYRSASGSSGVIIEGRPYPVRASADHTERPQ